MCITKKFILALRGSGACFLNKQSDGGTERFLGITVATRKSNTRFNGAREWEEGKILGLKGRTPRLMGTTGSNNTYHSTDLQFN